MLPLLLLTSTALATTFEVDLDVAVGDLRPRATTYVYHDPAVPLGAVDLQGSIPGLTCHLDDGVLRAVYEAQPGEDPPNTGTCAYNGDALVVHLHPVDVLDYARTVLLDQQPIVIELPGQGVERRTYFALAETPDGAYSAQRNGAPGPWVGVHCHVLHPSGYAVLVVDLDANAQAGAGQCLLPIPAPLQVIYGGGQ